MRILFDTSVLVAAMVEAHPAHTPALARLQRVRAGIDIGIVAAHSVAELYAVLTTLPVQPRITPPTAQHLITHNVFELLEVIALSAQDYFAIVAHLANLGIVGGVTYDAVILYTALSTAVDYVITLNEKDFCRVYPELASKIVTP